MIKLDINTNADILEVYRRIGKREDEGEVHPETVPATGGEPQDNSGEVEPGV